MFNNREIVKEYKYVGTIHQIYSMFLKPMRHLIEKARKAIFG